MGWVVVDRSGAFRVQDRVHVWHIGMMNLGVWDVKHAELHIYYIYALYIEFVELGSVECSICVFVFVYLCILYGYSLVYILFVSKLFYLPIFTSKGYQQYLYNTFISSATHDGSILIALVA